MVELYFEGLGITYIRRMQLEFFELCNSKDDMKNQLLNLNDSLTVQEFNVNNLFYYGFKDISFLHIYDILVEIGKKCGVEGNNDFQIYSETETILRNFCKKFLTFFEFKKTDNPGTNYLVVKGLVRRNKLSLTEIEAGDILACKFEGNSYNERATIRGVSKAAIIDTVNRGEKKLRKIATPNRSLEARE